MSDSIFFGVAEMAFEEGENLLEEELQCVEIGVQSLGHGVFWTQMERGDGGAVVA